LEGRALISNDVLASYAGDAAREVQGVRALVESHLPRHRGVRVLEDEGELVVELHLDVAWGASIPRVGAEVQRRVADYLERMADVRPARIDVAVDEIGPPPE